ncbi:acyl-CoA thioesterase [Paenibacillus lutrae]|uniref:YbgC/FadM family acyl-CoA thioesterase n=1 Tax=Paenibacillus lutrae TaxID=2078573 RepID=A0A7X3FJT7_9BACL|nr:thioesterase family protein [Paenibacillus lutrae]MVP00912.1 YbgC/FadM family acyl-CoA thioesterase [Paenibacillus lutrae]
MKENEAATGQEWFTQTLRVRYQETDQMGVVYHANYLTWLEIARTEYIRSKGFTYKTIEDLGLMLPVVGAELKYISPARYDDEITLAARIVEQSPVKLEFGYEVRRQEQLLVTGTTRHVWVNLSWKPVRINREAPDLYRWLQGG